MQQTEFGPADAYIRWTEAEGTGPVRVHVHGLGAASGPCTAHLSAYPELAGRRTLYVDLPGFGISDRPADFGYTLDDHAAALAAALDAAGVRGAELVAHSMGGAVAIVLAARRPGLVSRLVLIEANLDPDPPVTAGSSGIARCREEDFVHGGGLAEVVVCHGPDGARPVRVSARAVTVSGRDFHYRADAAALGPVRNRTWTVQPRAWRLTVPGQP